MKIQILTLVFILCYSTSFAVAPTKVDDKMTAEQIVTKHLASIGSEEARMKLNSLMAVGKVNVIFKGRGEGRAEGISVIASKGHKSLFGFRFDISEYPFEKWAYDGDDLTVAYTRPGEYTVLGGFLRVNRKTFETGLMGGTMTSGWALRHWTPKSGKLKARGSDKVDGKELLKVEVSPKGGSDLDITLFFDAETFRHVRTEYRRVISAAQGLTVDTSSRQSETRYKMVEDYSDFKQVGELTLPHVYSLYLEVLTGNGTTSYTWETTVQSFTVNSEIADADFDLGK